MKKCKFLDFLENHKKFLYKGYSITPSITRPSGAVLLAREGYILVTIWACPHLLFEVPWDVPKKQNLRKKMK